MTRYPLEEPNLSLELLAAVQNKIVKKFVMNMLCLAGLALIIILLIVSSVTSSRNTEKLQLLSQQSRSVVAENYGVELHFNDMQTLEISRFYCKRMLSAIVIVLLITLLLALLEFRSCFFAYTNPELYLFGTCVGRSRFWARTGHMYIMLEHSAGLIQVEDSVYTLLRIRRGYPVALADGGTRLLSNRTRYLVFDGRDLP